jgi:anti-sigma factor RsiW
MRTKREEVREMKCKELVELITEYLEGDLGAVDRERFERHIAGCDACTTYLAQMRQTISALGRIPPESLSPRVTEELLAAFRDWSASPS